MNLADHFHGIRLFPQNLVCGGVFDHEFGGAPVLLIAFARDQLKDHLVTVRSFGQSFLRIDPQKISAVQLPLVVFPDPAVDLLEKIRTMAVEANDKEAAGKALVTAVSHIDKAVTNGIHHKNWAARQKSNLTKAVNSL